MKGRVGPGVKGGGTLCLVMYKHVPAFEHMSDYLKYCKWVY